MSDNVWILSCVTRAPQLPCQHSCRNIIGAINNNYRKFRNLPWGKFVAWDVRYDTREMLRYAPFSENMIPRDKILFLAAVVQCTSSSCQDLEVTESCQVSTLDGRCGAISPNKVHVWGSEGVRERKRKRGREGERKERKKEEGTNDGEGRGSQNGHLIRNNSWCDDDCRKSA